VIPSSAVFTCAQLTKRYGDTVALDNVGFAIASGEYVALVGANGAGKTTLIKCLLDFCAFDRGEITIFGFPHDETSARETLAFLPERFSPPYYQTGRDFLRHILSLRGADYDEPRVFETLAALDLDVATLDRPVGHFSKGMTQKLGLAACFLSHQPFLLLDEPMSGLDPKARALVKRLLLKHRQAGTTLFFSTHMLADVAELCDRLIILHQGKVRFDGTPAACQARFGGGTLEEAYLHCIDEGIP
jgi:ABC-2 type transport system ATP-binding protein